MVKWLNKSFRTADLITVTKTLDIAILVGPENPGSELSEFMDRPITGQAIAVSGADGNNRVLGADQF